MKSKLLKILLVMVLLMVFIMPVKADPDEGNNNGGETPGEVQTDDPAPSVTPSTTTTTTTRTTTRTTTKSKSSNANLERILVNGEAIEDFDKDTKRYTVKVEYKIKKATVRGVAEDDNAIVKVEGPSTLSVGENEFTISVTSEDQTTKNYKVIVKREEKEGTNSTKLKNIKVVGYKLDFDKVSKTFYLKIDKEDTELEIVATPVDEDATVKIEGNEDLEDGSIIKIIVTSSKGDKATYKIIIEKKDTNIVPFIIGGIVLLVAFAVGIFIMIQNKKQDKADKIKAKREENERKEKEHDEDDFDALKEDNDEMEKTKQMPLIDNDEEEKTRMFSFDKDELDYNSYSDEKEDTSYDDFKEDDDEDLEKTKVIKFSYDEDE